MPSFTFTPGALVLAGGEFNPEPIRFTYDPGRLTLQGGSFNIGSSLSTSLEAVLNAVLDTLSSAEAIVDERGRPTRRFQQIWQNAIGALKDALTTQGGEIDELQQIYAAINVAQQTAASAVQTANATQAYIDITNSFTDPVGVGSASSDGTVTITSHHRVYPGSASRVSVDGGAVTGLTTGTYVTVFYTDPTREGGAVSYQGTTSAISQSGDAHIVWQGIIPSPGEPDAPGSGPTAPGYTGPPPSYDPRELEYERVA